MNKVVFIALGIVSASCAHAPQTANEATTPALSAEPREQTADQQVAHAMNRLAFGPRPGELQRVRAMGVDRWIEQQLQPGRIPDGTTDQMMDQSYSVLAESPGDLVRDYPPPNVVRQQLRRADSTTREDSMKLREAARGAQRIVGELQSAKVARAVVSERQLQEVMTDFWENHFNIYVAKGPQQRYSLVGFDRDVIRPNAMGRFRSLLGAVAKSPAMLFYLDNWQSTADSAHNTLGGGFAGRNPRRLAAGGQRPATAQLPLQRRPKGLNENYARELMELHTLGVDGGYSQKDVIEVARALTGWSIQAPQQGGEFAFRPAMHDADEKTVLGHTLKAGRGEEDGEEVLDIVAHHPSTARFIATKLVRRFVSDSAPKALVDRAAATFTRTDGDIRETLRTIFSSQEFWSQAAYRSKVKSPFETVVSAMRALNAAPDTTPRSAFLVASLGQPIFGHQAPNGWPETGTEWMNTGAILNRINFGLAVAAGRVPGASVAGVPSLAALQSAPREQQVDAVVAALFAGEVSHDTRAVLMSGSNPLLGAARQAGDSSMADPAMAGDEPMRAGDGMPPRQQGPRAAARQTPFRSLPQLTGMNQIVGLALGAPEFQRR